MSPDEYMREVLEPTIQDLAQNRASKRHAFLACLATYHLIDYLCGKRRKAVLRGEYRTQSAAFAVVDRIANGRGDGQQGPPRSALRFDKTSAASAGRSSGRDTSGNVGLAKFMGEETNIVALVNEASNFLAKKVREQASQEDEPAYDTYYVVVPFDQNAEGELEPGKAREAISAVLAERLARALAREHAGAIAFSRSGDSESGDFQEPVVLATFGEVDLSAMREKRQVVLLPARDIAGARRPPSKLRSGRRGG
jgi:hypothetical protein